jgi:hypothetical protein
MAKTLPVAALGLAIALAAAPAARANATQESVIEDEHAMLELGPVAQANALDDVKALGADVVRANILWSRFAPKPNSKKRPKHPDRIAAGKFAALDGLVAGAQARGLDVLLTPTGPAPAWASRCRGSVKLRHTCKPDPKRFGAFVRALGRRYPQVHRWSIWNEPNQPGWLSPQYVSRHGRRVPIAADLYRSLARSAISALRATGHGRQQILIGETSPVGRAAGTLARIPITPAIFIRELFCLTRTARGCRHFHRFPVTGYAHHPYTRGGSRAPRSKTNPGEITIGSASRLHRLLNQAARRHRIPRGLPIYYTENGWQTNPPDRLFGVSLAKQAAYLNESDYMAYRDRRVRMVAQYKLSDDRPLGSFQSGVRFWNGRLKPSYGAYRLPLWVVRRGSRVVVYGQVRPAPNGTVQRVQVQSAPKSGRRFKTVRTVTVHSRRGQFVVRLRRSGTFWRLVWNGMKSRRARAAPR